MGSAPRVDALDDDFCYLRDLCLIAPDAPVRIANDIYKEVVPRALSYQMQEYLDQQAAWYLRPDGTPDMVLLLASFQEFFAESSESWLARFHYQEAGNCSGGLSDEDDSVRTERRPWPPSKAGWCGSTPALRASAHHERSTPLNSYGGGAAPDADGLPAARGERRGPHHQAVRGGQRPGGSPGRVRRASIGHRAEAAARRRHRGRGDPPALRLPGAGGRAGGREPGPGERRPPKSGIGVKKPSAP